MCTYVSRTHLGVFFFREYSYHFYSLIILGLVIFIFRGYLHSLVVRTGIDKKILPVVRDFKPKYNFLSSREVNERLREIDSSLESKRELTSRE